MKRSVVLSVVVACGLAAAGLAAQQPQAQELQIEKLADNLYVIAGNGGNTAAYISSDGVVRTTVRRFSTR